mgnify:CR=1 FL=1
MRWRSRVELPRFHEPFSLYPIPAPDAATRQSFPDIFPVINPSLNLFFLNINRVQFKILFLCPFKCPCLPEHTNLLQLSDLFCPKPLSGAHRKALVGNPLSKPVSVRTDILVWHSQIPVLLIIFLCMVKSRSPWGVLIPHHPNPIKQRHLFT